MTLRLLDIRALDMNSYEVIFEEENGTTEKAVCTIVKHKGVESMRMRPDFVWMNELKKIDGQEVRVARVNGREVVAAVLAYHHRLQGTEHDGNSSS